MANARYPNLIGDLDWGVRSSACTVLTNGQVPPPEHPGDSSDNLHHDPSPGPRRDYSPRLTSASQWASNSTHFLVLKELRRILMPVELKTGFGGFWYPKYFERRTESCARQEPGNWQSIRKKVTESGQVTVFRIAPRWPVARISIA